MLLKLFFGIVLAVTSCLAKQHDCTVPIGSRELYRYQWPLVYTTNGDLYEMQLNDQTEQRIKIKGNADVLLSCGPNYFKSFFRKETINAKCDEATGNFTVKNNMMSIKELSCDLRVIEEIVTPVVGCEKTGWTGVHFGYVDPIEQMTFVLGEACYDMAEGKTLFAHVKLGADKDASILQKSSKNYLTSQRHPDGRYKIELFRGLQFDTIYNRLRADLKTSQIPQLKMSNFIDEPFLSNIQLQPIKKLSWNYYVGFDDHIALETLKGDIRKLSEKLNLDIYVGSHGVKTFKGSNGSKSTLYLHPGRFPMPEYIWFAVQSQDRSIAIAIINDGSNVDITANSLDNKNEQLCANSDCSKVSWLSSNLRNSHTSVMVCCPIDELHKSVKGMPVLDATKELLL